MVEVTHSTQSHTMMTLHDEQHTTSLIPVRAFCILKCILMPPKLASFTRRTRAALLPAVEAILELEREDHLWYSIVMGACLRRQAHREL